MDRIYDGKIHDRIELVLATRTCAYIVNSKDAVGIQ